MLRVSFLAQYAQGRAVALAASLREQEELQKQLSHQATHDPLTGLANRTLLHERMESALSRCSAVSGTGLVMVDLDGFKDVNDTLGHPVGDDLLVDVAGRLTSRVREQDLVARLGGDEFALLVEGVDARTLHDYTKRLLDAFKDPFILAHGNSVRVTASIGARSITRPTTPSKALRDADTALYQAKTAGKNQAVFFESPQ
ncbi:diguanylate cyclase domain-containing protein [Streptomyces sp. NPDC006602]|uniref:diguanylate cyclase domain-containing protein n=1 Tax=Streptomyces sp. NPDC006602 TaxID=3364751 RepID=UPI003678658A